MIPPPDFGIRTVYEHWRNAATTLLAYQWQLFDAQYQAGLKIVQAACGIPGPRPEGGPVLADEVRKLEQRAAERVSQGLAPPREIYQAPYRAQIDWGKFPEWARPSDPEMFKGGHEG
jgi:hypothetical protein